MTAAVRSLGIDLRAGLHTGEIELRGNDVAGMAVHIGARVSALAGAGDVVVSSTVKDLVAGSGIEFEDRGKHELKGFPDRGGSTQSLVETRRQVMRFRSGSPLSRERP
jgi:class 3 adenylate cyclase